LSHYIEDPQLDIRKKQFAEALIEWFNLNYSVKPSIFSRLHDSMPYRIRRIIRTDISKNHIFVSFYFSKDSETVSPESPFLEGNPYYTALQSEIFSEYKNIKFNKKFPLGVMLEKDHHFAYQLDSYMYRHYMNIIISSDRFNKYVESYGVESFIELFKTKFKENEELMKKDFSELEDIFQKNTLFLLREKLASKESIDYCLSFRFMDDLIAGFKKFPHDVQLLLALSYSWWNIHTIFAHLKR
jgi:hypothetical protein